MTPTTCLSCMPGLYLFATNSSCVSCDFAGVYRDSSTQQCLFCDATCATCEGPLTCLTCVSGRYLYANFTCGLCLKTSMVRFGTGCVACDSTCATCSDPTSRGCITCPKSRYLSSQGVCSLKAVLYLDRQRWYSDFKEVIFTFSDMIMPAAGSITDVVEVGLFTDDFSAVSTTVRNANDSLPISQIASSLTPVTGWSVSSVSISGQRLKVGLDLSKTITEASMVVRFKAPNALREHQISTKCSQIVCCCILLST